MVMIVVVLVMHALAQERHLTRKSPLLGLGWAHVNRVLHDRSLQALSFRLPFDHAPMPEYCLGLLHGVRLLCSLSCSLLGSARISQT